MACRFLLIDVGCAMASPAVRSLPDHWRRFVHAYVNSGNIELASAESGFSGSAGQYVIRQEAVQAALRQEMQRALSEDAAAARAFLRTILDGTAFPEERRNSEGALKLRADVGKTLMDRAGYVAPKVGDGASPGAKDPSEMSSDELRAFIDKAEATLADRAQTVDSAPDAPVNAPQLADMLD